VPGLFQRGGISGGAPAAQEGCEAPAKMFFERAGLKIGRASPGPDSLLLDEVACALDKYLCASLDFKKDTEYPWRPGAKFTAHLCFLPDDGHTVLSGLLCFARTGQLDQHVLAPQ